MKIESFENILNRGVFFNDLQYTLYYKTNLFLLKNQYEKIIYSYNINNLKKIIISYSGDNCFILLLFNYHDSYEISKNKLIFSFKKNTEKNFIKYLQEWFNHKQINYIRNDYL